MPSNFRGVSSVCLCIPAPIFSGLASSRAVSVAMTNVVLSVTCATIKLYSTSTRLFGMFVSKIWRALFEITSTTALASRTFVQPTCSIVGFSTTTSKLLLVTSNGECVYGGSVNGFEMTTLWYVSPGPDLEEDWLSMWSATVAEIAVFAATTIKLAGRSYQCTSLRSTETIPRIYLSMKDVPNNRSTTGLSIIL